MANFEEEILIKDVTGRFKILRGGKLYDLEEVIPKPSPAVPPSLAVQRVIRESGIKVEEQFKKRLEEIIDAYFRNVRDKFETKSILMQPVKFGGMGLNQEEADLVIELIDKAKTKAEEIKKPAKEAPLPLKAEVPPTAPPPVSPKIPPPAPEAAPSITRGVAEFVFSPADEQEILAHKEKLPAVIAGLKPIEIAKFVYEIIQESEITLDKDKRNKLENIILTHLKDIRDGFETKQTLLQATESARLVLSLEQTEKILKIAKSKLQNFENELKKKEEEKIKKVILEEKEKQKEKWEKAEALVKEKIDARWSQITGRPPEPVEVGSELVSPPLALWPKALRPSAPTAPSIIQTAEGAPLAPSPPEVLPPRLIGPLPKVEKKAEIFPPPPLKEEKLPKRVPSPPVQPPPAPTMREAPPVTPSIVPKEKPLELFKPVPSEERTTLIFRRPEIPSKRPRIEDVKVRPRLVGPVEELRELTLIDFRRLAPTPILATQKILEKINLLEKESFSKKIAGIKAWQQSEVSKIYLEISREILTKKMTVSQIIAERSRSGKPTLTEEEYRAVMELNRSLRY